MFTEGGAVIGEIGTVLCHFRGYCRWNIAFYLLSPLSDYFKREFSLVESAGMMLLSAGSSCSNLLLQASIAVLVRKGVKWLENRMVKMALQDILVGVGGLIIGLIMANLIAHPWPEYLLQEVSFGYCPCPVWVYRHCSCQKQKR